MKAKYLAACMISTVLIVSGLGGCQSAGGTAAAESSNQVAESNKASTESLKNESVENASAAITYDEDDQDVTWSEDTSTLITCSGTSVLIKGEGAAESEGSLTITEAGTYVISGTLSDGKIVIDAGAEDLVHLVLNKVSVTSSDGPSIYGKQSGKIVITLAEGTENTATDGSDYSELDEKSEPDAAVFSKDDITINGTGSLSINGNYKNGIHSKDGLKIIGGTLSINTVNHDIIGKDYVAVSGGVMQLSSVEDAIHSAADVWITGGNMIIDAGDDGIHGDGGVTIDGGTIQIKNSTEGIEGTVVTINGGDISVNASDDGINSTDATSEDTSTAMNEGTGGMGGMDTAQENVLVEITGGTLYVNAEGDGIDSNGNLSVTGGEITVAGSTRGGNGIIDYNGTAKITGGTIVAAGTSDMAQTFSGDSGQCSLLYIYNAVQSTGTALSLKDSSGNVIVSLIPEKDYGAVIISSPKMKEGETYTLYSESTKIADITLDSVSTTSGASQGGGDMNREMKRGEMPNGGPGQDRP